MFVSLLTLLPSVLALAVAWAFSPVAFLGELGDAPIVAALSPIVSQLAQPGLFGLAIEALFLLVAGRYVERALGPGGVVLVFVAGAFGGAAARLMLTPGSMTPGLAANGALFATVGAYLMLYGVPRGVPVSIGGGRPRQIALLAAVWAGLQLAFMLVAPGADVSMAIVEPLGGLLAGAAVARLLLAWRWRRA